MKIPMLAAAAALFLSRGAGVVAAAGADVRPGTQAEVEAFPAAAAVAAVEKEKKKKFAYATVLDRDPLEGEEPYQRQIDAVASLLRGLESANTAADVVVLTTKSSGFQASESDFVGMGAIVKHVEGVWGLEEGHDSDGGTDHPSDSSPSSYAGLRAFQMTEYSRVQLLDPEAAHLLREGEGLELNRMFERYAGSDLVVASGTGGTAESDSDETTPGVLLPGWMMLVPSREDFDALLEGLASGGGGGSDWSSRLGRGMLLGHFGTDGGGRLAVADRQELESLGLGLGSAGELSPVDDSFETKDEVDAVRDVGATSIGYQPKDLAVAISPLPTTKKLRRRKLNVLEEYKSPLSGQCVDADEREYDSFYTEDPDYTFIATACAQFCSVLKNNPGYVGFEMAPSCKCLYEDGHLPDWNEIAEHYPISGGVSFGSIEYRIGQGPVAESNGINGDTWACHAYKNYIAPATTTTTTTTTATTYVISQTTTIILLYLSFRSF